MADATKRIAADESFRTTDGNDTNLADLMQSGLLNIANALANLPSYSAGNITYDNSTSGLAATDVKDALDELASEKADASGVYTKAQTDAKIAALDYSDTAVSGSYVTKVAETDGVIAVTREAADATPTSGSKKMVTSGGVYTALSALNDGLTQNYADSGVMGAKNLLPLSLDTMQSINTSGTWSGNVYNRNGVDFTVNTDDNGNVTSIVADGTAGDSNATIGLANLTLDYSSYTISGLSAAGSDSTFWMFIVGILSVYSKSGSTVTRAFSNNSVGLAIKSGQTVSNLTFYPMIRLATDTDDTFQPYAKTNLQLTNDVASLIAKNPKTRFVAIGASASININLSAYYNVISSDMTLLTVVGISLNNSSVYNKFLLGIKITSSTTHFAVIENTATSTANVNYSFSFSDDVLTITNSGNWGSQMSLLFI